ncbi:MAG: MotA/TolQ/ExbB proton channel family protein [Spirochaetes bacterium]|nr:MAG: MotA/TolQ/ExbB proton channel family protein [Spirochaetota bacterium]
MSVQMSIGTILASGNITLYLLILCSIVSFAIIIERVIYFRRNASEPRAPFMKLIRESLRASGAAHALEQCGLGSTVMRVVREGLEAAGAELANARNAMERQISVETRGLEKFTSLLGTIGSTAVYIGLFGTVIGIIRAFGDISAAGVGGINIVIGGIAEALVSTAAGILVAVPSVIAYNLIMRRIDTAIADMELCESELMDLLAEKR